MQTLKEIALVELAFSMVAQDAMVQGDLYFMFCRGNRGNCVSSCGGEIGFHGGDLGFEGLTMPLMDFSHHDFRFCFCVFQVRSELCV